ncbi:hypothetical protein DNHGIG_17740 [Collibacillus ludicampi]|jgi:hypothetical protein|uniref:YtkA-like domain-containing protein n=1 Tax=Collibacillus ludicampi TaxID=2771369 RepID=A0AAV4LEI2_9BACL|nr:FixH family protein [Collibacillus ludicampi]GIM46225.1 hypothetical protein DNHGIG_17740 [Collibacillus ludicampi]
MRIPVSRWLPALAALTIVTFAWGCSSNTTETASLDSSPLHVSFSTTPPSTVKVGDQVTITVTVSQNGKPVEDAKDVTFEVWKEKQDQHEMIKANKNGDGVYSIPYTFRQEGTYFIMYHVTARDQHSMQKMELKVSKR